MVLSSSRGVGAALRDVRRGFPAALITLPDPERGVDYLAGHARQGATWRRNGLTVAEKAGPGGPDRSLRLLTRIDGTPTKSTP
ncbi:hypothetical protein ACWEQL_38590 [Kitasatospora sp. NPDC004240]